MLTVKIKSFLKDLKDKPAPTDEERIKALKLIAETMQEKELILIQTREELQTLSQKINVRTDRLAHIRNRIALAVKSGIANDTVH